VHFAIGKAELEGRGTHAAANIAHRQSPASKAIPLALVSLFRLLKSRSTVKVASGKYRTDLVAVSLTTKNQSDARLPYPAPVLDRAGSRSIWRHTIVCSARCNPEAPRLQYCKRQNSWNRQPSKDLGAQATRQAPNQPTYIQSIKNVIICRNAPCGKPRLHVRVAKICAACAGR
jgi:hypothetical protein